METEPETEVVVRCEGCNKVLDETSISVNDSSYCENCVIRCDLCEEYYTAGEEFVSYVTRRSYHEEDGECCPGCTDSLSQCADCDKYFQDSLNYTNLNDERICSCCDDSYNTCEECEERYRAEGGPNCSCNNNDGLLDHDYKPTPVFFGNPADGIFLGAELEVEVINNADREEEVERLHKIEGLEDFIYMKYDGSLDHGIEIVTHPASLDELKKRFDIFFGTPHPNFVSYKSDTCGFHVHASREPLKGLTIPKIMTFINNKDNFTYLKKLAQRYNDYSKIRDKKLTDVKFNKEKYKPKISYEEEDRYEALNTQNSDTIEFRLFKGTLFKQSIFRYLEFCHAIIKYSWPSSRSIKDSYNYLKFIEFVNKERKRYPNLHWFHNNKGTFSNTKDTQFPFPIECPANDALLSHIF